VRSLKQMRGGQPSLDVSAMLEALQAQAGVLQEVRQRLSEKPADTSGEPEIRKAVAGLSEIVKQLREDKSTLDLSPVLEEVRSLKHLRDGKSAVDLSPVLEEVRSLKQMREGQPSLDVSAMLEALQAQAGVLQEVRQRLSEKPAGTSDEPEIREAVACLSEMVKQLREDKSAVDLSSVLEEVRSLKQIRESQPSSDVSPVLEVVRVQADVTQEDKPAVDLSTVLEEVRSLKQLREDQPCFDVSAMLGALQAQAGVLQEVRQMLSEKLAGASDEPEIREALVGLSKIVKQLREDKPAVDLSAVLEEVRSLKQLQEGQPSLDLSPVLEAVRAQAGELQDIRQSLSERLAGASDEPKICEAAADFSEVLEQPRGGKSAVDMSPVLEQVRSPQQLRDGQAGLDVSPVLEAMRAQAALLQEVHQSLSEKPARTSDVPEFREALADLSEIARHLREGKAIVGLSPVMEDVRSPNQLRELKLAADLSPVLEEVRSLKQFREGQPSLDLSPVLEAVRAQAEVLHEVRQRLSEKPAGASDDPEFREAVKIVRQGLSEIANQPREGKSAVDLSLVLEEVRSLKQSRESPHSLDVSPVLEAVRAQAGVLQEVRQRLSETPAGASDDPEFREAVAGLAEIVKQLREGKSAVDLSPVLEEVRSLKQLRDGQPSLDVSHVLEAVRAQAGVLQEVRQRLSEKPAGASDEPEFREATADLSEALEQPSESREGSRRSSGATAVDLSPVLEAMRAQADSLQEVRHKVMDLDLSQVLEGVQHSKAGADLAAKTLGEVKRMKQAFAVDFTHVLEDIRKMATTVDRARLSSDLHQSQGFHE